MTTVRIPSLVAMQLASDVFPTLQNPSFSMVQESLSLVGPNPIGVEPGDWRIGSIAPTRRHTLGEEEGPPETHPKTMASHARELRAFLRPRSCNVSGPWE